MIYLVVFIVSCFFFAVADNIEEKETQVLSIAFGKKKSISFYLCAAIGLLLPSLLAGLSDSSIGTDVELYGNYWFIYAGKYKFIPYMKMASEQSIGLVYALLNYLVSIVTDDTRVFYFVLSLVETTLVYFGIRGFKDKISIAFGMFCYYTIFYNNSLNLLRQMLAVSIVCYSYQFLLKNRYVLFSVLAVLAVMSHSSAIFVIVLLFGWLYLKRHESKTETYFVNLILFVVILFIMLTYQTFLKFMISHHILSERYFTYLQETIVGGRMIRLGFWSALAVLAYIAFRQMINYDVRNKFLISCITMSCAFSFVMFMGNVYAIRMAYYFDGAAIILIPMIPKIYKLEIDNVRKMKYLPYLLLGVVLIARWYLEYVHSLNGETYPYRFASF